MIKRELGGLTVALIFGYLALVLGSQIPLLGSSILALLTGLTLSGWLKTRPDWQPGLTLASKKGLQYSIILLGFRLSFRDIQDLGLWSLQISLPLALLALGLSVLIGKRLKLTRRLSLLIGFGTAICGGSAIASAAPILEAEEDEVGLALSTIFLFNLLALVVFPPVGQLLQLSQDSFGLWAGTAINDTSSVVAAGYGYGTAAGDAATVVKLARTLLIVPACLAFALFPLGKWQSRERGFSLKQIFPTFILWFLLASLVSSLGLLPKSLLTASRFLSQLLMATALFAVGSKMSLRQIKTAGVKPLLLGGLVWLTISLVSLALQALIVRG